MLCHAVVFTSFEVPQGSTGKIEICTLDRDPRMKAFVEFIWHNYLKEKKVQFLKRLEEVEARNAESKEDLKKIEDLIKSQTKESNEPKQ